MRGITHLIHPSRSNGHRYVNRQAAFERLPDATLCSGVSPRVRLQAAQRPSLVNGARKASSSNRPHFTYIYVLPASFSSISRRPVPFPIHRWKKLSCVKHSNILMCAAISAGKSGTTPNPPKIVQQPFRVNRRNRRTGALLRCAPLGTATISLQGTCERDRCYANHYLIPFGWWCHFWGRWIERVRQVAEILPLFHTIDHVDMSHADTAKITIQLVGELICILATKRQLGWMMGLSDDYNARMTYIYGSLDYVLCGYWECVAEAGLILSLYNKSPWLKPSLSVSYFPTLDGSGLCLFIDFKLL